MATVSDVPINNALLDKSNFLAFDPMRVFDRIMDRVAARSAAKLNYGAEIKNSITDTREYVHFWVKGAQKFSRSVYMRNFLMDLNTGEFEREFESLYAQAATDLENHRKSRGDNMFNQSLVLEEVRRQIAYNYESPFWLSDPVRAGTTLRVKWINHGKECRIRMTNLKLDKRAEATLFTKEDLSKLSMTNIQAEIGKSLLVRVTEVCEQWVTQARGDGYTDNAAWGAF